jgi:hypothetical protein
VRRVPTVMASLYEKVWTLDEMGALAESLRAHAEYSVARGKQTSYEIFANSYTALSQLIKEHRALQLKVGAK